MWELIFPEKITAKELAESIHRAMAVCRQMGIKGRRPALQSSRLRSWNKVPSYEWYLLKCSKGFVSVLAGVLAGEGYLVKVSKVPDPWDKQEAPPVEGQGLEVEDTG